MRELFRCMRAELVKMRHTFLYPLHILLPLTGSAVFLLYYSVTGRSGTAQISGYVEIVGITLPFAVSIVCAGNVALEEKNHFQSFLSGAPHKWNSFLAKCLALWGMGAMAATAAVLFFAAGYGRIPGKEGLSTEINIWIAVLLGLGSLPLYLEHLFLNLRFTRSVSLCAGVAEFLLSALFLTGLGEGRWLFFPCTWSARGAALFLALAAREEMGNMLRAEGRGVPVVCLLILIMICVIIRIWFHFYEGRQCND